MDTHRLLILISAASFDNIQSVDDITNDEYDLIYALRRLIDNRIACAERPRD